jgi:hypothetical protein
VSWKEGESDGMELMNEMLCKSRVRSWTKVRLRKILSWLPPSAARCTPSTNTKNMFSLLSQQQQHQQKTILFFLIK